MPLASSYSAFSGNRLIAFGPLAGVLGAAKAHLDGCQDPNLLIFEDHTGRQLDFDFSGTLEAVLERALPAPKRSRRGRPKLGVVSREVSLLPRHWEWLEAQQHGISAGLRRLVDDAQQPNAAAQRAREGREAASKFMTAMASKLENYEAAMLALLASDQVRFALLLAARARSITRALTRGASLR